MNTFDAKTHSFFIGGRSVLSVTQALKGAGIIEDGWYTEESRERGCAVHNACQYLDEGLLDWDTVAPKYLPYVKAYERFKDESGFIPALIEAWVFNESYFYAGILDRTGILNGEHVLIDLKSGPPAKWANLQSAAYAGCLSLPHKRFTLRLSDNGKYKLSDEHKDPNDFKIFLSAVSVANWKRNGGKHGSSFEVARVA